MLIVYFLIINHLRRRVRKSESERERERERESKLYQTAAAFGDNERWRSKTRGGFGRRLALGDVEV